MSTLPEIINLKTKNMEYTKDNVIGIKFKTSRNSAEIFTIEDGKVSWLSGDTVRYASYLMQDLARYLNDKTWYIIESEVVNNYQIF